VPPPNEQRAKAAIGALRKDASKWDASAAELRDAAGAGRSIAAECAALLLSGRPTGRSRRRPWRRGRALQGGRGRPCQCAAAGVQRGRRGRKNDKPESLAWGRNLALAPDRRDWGDAAEMPAPGRSARQGTRSSVVTALPAVALRDGMGWRDTRQKTVGTCARRPRAS
jgi:hypothetical protein